MYLWRLIIRVCLHGTFKLRIIHRRNVHGVLHTIFALKWIPITTNEDKERDNTRELEEKQSRTFAPPDILTIDRFELFRMRMSKSEHCFQQPKIVNMVKYFVIEVHKNSKA